MLTASQVFTLVLTDSNGCSVQDSVRIDVNPQLIADADSDRVICYAETTLLDGSANGGAGGYSYQWSPTTNLSDASLPNPLVTGLTSTQVYQLVLTDARACTDTAYVTVTANPELVADAGGDGAICYGAPTALNGSATGGTPGYTYNWTPATGLSNPSLPNPGITNLTGSITYYLTVTDALGCNDMDSIQIIVNPELIVAATGDSVCFGETGNLQGIATGGSPGYTYQWLPAAGLTNPDSNITQVLTPVQTQVYSLIATDAVGCRDTALATLTVNPVLNAFAGPDRVLCFGDTVLIGGNPAATRGSGGFGYTWTPATGLAAPTGPQTTVSNLAASQTYELLVTDLVGCTARDSVSVFADPPLFVDAGPGDSICYQASTTIASDVSGGSLPYQYNWTPPTGLNSTVLASPVSSGLTLSTTYMLTVTDLAGCQVSDSTFIWVNSEIVAVVPSDSLCEDATGVLPSTVTGGLPGYLYQWTPSDFLSAIDVANPLVTGLDTTTTYTLVVTDIQGCTDTATATITFVPLPEPDFNIAFPCFNAQNSPACVNELITLIDVSTSSPDATPIVYWEWDVDNDGVIDYVGDTVSLTYSQVGTYTIELIVTTQAGCRDSVTKTLTVVDVPAADFSVAPDSGCAPLSIALTDSSSGYILAYDWQIYGIDVQEMLFRFSAAISRPSRRHLCFSRAILATRRTISL
ncbi:MAG: hypothetical protein OHK0039_18150 [Bacteroidia bacterium]